MAETTIKKPIGRAVLWEEFRKQHPNLPDFINIGDFLSWAIKQTPPISNPYGLWEARLDAQATEATSQEKEEPAEEKPKEKKVKKEKHEEYESPIIDEELDEDEEQKKEETTTPVDTQAKTSLKTEGPTEADSLDSQIRKMEAEYEELRRTSSRADKLSELEAKIEALHAKKRAETKPANSPTPATTNPPQTQAIENPPPNQSSDLDPIEIESLLRARESEYEEIRMAGARMDKLNKMEEDIENLHAERNRLNSRNSIEQWRDSSPIDRPTRQAARYANNPRVLKPNIPSVARASSIASKAKKVSWLVRIPYAIPVIAVIIIVILLILVPVIIIGKASEDPIFAVQVGLNPFFANNSNQPSIAPTLPPAGGGETAKCNANPRDCLKNEFNFEIRGSANTGQMNDVFNLLSEVTVAPEYRRLLRSSGPTEVEFINDSSKGEGCPARVRPIGNGHSKLTLYNYPDTCDRVERKSRLVHESGHILRNGHLQLFNRFENDAYNKDRDCYNRDGRFAPSYFIKTYDTSFGAGQGVSLSGSNESMAEFIALHVIPDGAYPRKCPVGYNWVINNIFGNYRF